MASMYDLTSEEINGIMKYVETGDLAQLSQEAVKKFNSLHSALSSRLYSDMMKSSGKTRRLEQRIDRMKAADEARFEAGVFSDSGLDSVDVMTMLLYHLQRIDREQPYSEKMRITNAKLVLILFEMYASWLYSKKQRLFLEHPSAAEYYIALSRRKSEKLPAPQFWRAFKRNMQNSTVTYQTYMELAGKTPEVAAFAKNAAEKYYSYDEDTLRRYFVKTKAFVNADKDHNAGKWGKEIADADIYAWKVNEKEK